MDHQSFWSLKKFWFQPLNFTAKLGSWSVVSCRHPLKGSVFFSFSHLYQKQLLGLWYVPAFSWFYLLNFDDKCIGKQTSPMDSIWSNYSDLTRPHPKWCFSKGNPLISGKSRLVKYYNLARFYGNGQSRPKNKWFLTMVIVTPHRSVALHVKMAESTCSHQELSHEKNPGCLGYIRDYTAQFNYMGVIINHYKLLLL